jgi:hypothetical protein
MKNDELYLQEGDVIKLKKGMKVYTKIPEMFVYSNALTSKKIVSNQPVIVGEILKNVTDISCAVSHVIERTIKAFESEGFVANLNAISTFVGQNIDDPIPAEFIIEEGEFVVVKTNLEGGGIAMFHDEYSDGHRAYCKRLKNGIYDPDGQEVNFYQSGGFTAMIADIKPSRKMKKTESYSLQFE